MKAHELKTWPEEFAAMGYGDKTAEFRKNDRDFKGGDLLVLRLYDPESERYLGESFAVQVTHIMYGGQFGIPEGYVVMSIEKLTEPCENEI